MAFQLLGMGGREARLLPEYAPLYPQLKAGRWVGVRWLIRRLRATSVLPGGRFPFEDHFELRGGALARNPAWPNLRQRATDTVVADGPSVPSLSRW